jgi:hypothetical protein
VTHLQAILRAVAQDLSDLRLRWALVGAGRLGSERASIHARGFQRERDLSRDLEQLIAQGV